MKDLVEYVAKQIVTKPEAVVVEESSDQMGVTLTLTVDPSDMGIVIGKSGQTIKAIRKLLTVKAIAENVRVRLNLYDPQAGALPQETPEATEPQESPTEEVL